MVNKIENYRRDEVGLKWLFFTNITATNRALLLLTIFVWVPFYYVAV